MWLVRPTKANTTHTTHGSWRLTLIALLIGQTKSLRQDPVIERSVVLVARQSSQTHC